MVSETLLGPSTVTLSTPLPALAVLTKNVFFISGKIVRVHAFGMKCAINTCGQNEYNFLKILIAKLGV